VTDVSPEVVRLFLRHLEESRKCAVATRNQRLAAIHSLARFVSLYSPEHIEWCGQLRAIPPKRTPRATITYLDKPEMDALLNAPDQSTEQGRRDHALLLFLYNTGARADEAAQVKIADLLLAKGNKLRRCPLWPQTLVELSSLTASRPTTDHVFLNRCGHLPAEWQSGRKRQVRLQAGVDGPFGQAIGSLAAKRCVHCGRR
jgi:integrase/recombinase XerD